MAIYTSHRLALLVLSILLLLVVLELVRRGLLKERYALLWLATSAFGLLVGVFPMLIVKFAEWTRLQFVTVMFLAAFLFILALLLSFSIVISRLVERNRELTQEVALLANALEQPEGKGDE